MWVNSVDLVWNAILSSAAQEESEPVSEAVVDNDDVLLTEAESSPGSDLRSRVEKSTDPVVDRGSELTREDALQLVVVSASAVTAPVIVLPEEDDAVRNDNADNRFLATALRSTNDFGGATNTTATDPAFCVGA